MEDLSTVVPCVKAPAKAAVDRASLEIGCAGLTVNPATSLVQASPAPAATASCTGATVAVTSRVDVPHGDALLPGDSTSCPRSAGSPQKATDSARSLARPSSRAVCRRWTQQALRPIAQSGIVGPSHLASSTTNTPSEEVLPHSSASMLSERATGDDATAVDAVPGAKGVASMPTAPPPDQSQGQAAGAGPCEPCEPCGQGNCAGPSSAPGSTPQVLQADWKDVIVNGAEINSSPSSGKGSESDGGPPGASSPCPGCSRVRSPSPALTVLVSSEDEAMDGDVMGASICDGPVQCASRGPQHHSQKPSSESRSVSPVHRCQPPEASACQERAGAAACPVVPQLSLATLQAEATLSHAEGKSTAGSLLERIQRRQSQRPSEATASPLDGHDGTPGEEHAGCPLPPIPKPPLDSCSTQPAQPRTEDVPSAPRASLSMVPEVSAVPEPASSPGGSRSSRLHPELLGEEALKAWMQFFGMKPASSTEFMVRRLREIDAYLGQGAGAASGPASALAPAAAQEADQAAEPLMAVPARQRGRPRKRPRRAEENSIALEAGEAAGLASESVPLATVGAEASSANAKAAAKASKAAAKAADLEQAIANAIRGDTELYERLLLFEPVEINELRERLAAVQPELRGLGEQRLRKFLDNQGLLFASSWQSQRAHRRF